MVLIYFILLTFAMLVTAPLISRRLVFAYVPEERLEYNPLHGLSRSNRKLVYCAFGLLYVMMAIAVVNRPEYLPDYQMYEHLYRTTLGNKSLRDMEISFTWISMLSPTFMVLLTVYALLSVGTHMWAILRNAPIIWISLGLYMTFQFVLHDMVQMRSGVALGLMLISLRYIVERKWWIYFPLVMLALFFHNSAVVLIPLYFLKAKSLNRYVWGSILGAAVLLHMAGMEFGIFSKFIPIGIIETYLENYMGRDMAANSIDIDLHRILEIIAIFVMIIRIKYLQSHYPLAVICIKMLVFSQIFYLLFSDIAVIQIRMGELFGSAGILGYAMFPMVSRKHYYVLLIYPLLLMLTQIGGAYYLLTAFQP